MQLRSQLTKLYVDKGYVTSGVIILPQTIKAGLVVMQVIEGSLEKINVIGTRRLNPDYVSDRLAMAAGNLLACAIHPHGGNGENWAITSVLIKRSPSHFVSN